MQDGNIVDVWAVDRADSAVIVLEEITADGEYIVDSQTVDIVWPMSEMIYGISEEYKLMFFGVNRMKLNKIMAFFCIGLPICVCLRIFQIENWYLILQQIALKKNFGNLLGLKLSKEDAIC